MRQDEVLTPNDDGWRWDTAAIRRYIGAGSIDDVLSDKVALMPSKSRDLLRIAACLGGSVPVELLILAADMPATTVLGWLERPLADGLVLLDQTGGHPDTSSRANVVRFRHDRVYEAVLAGLDVTDRTALHLTLARRLGRAPGREVEAAEQYLGCGGAAVKPAEQRRMADLFRFAAAQTRRVGQYTTAERFLSAAKAIWERLGISADDPGLTDLETEWHAALYSLGRLEDADVVYASIERRCDSPIKLVPAACIQVSSLSQRRQHHDALALGLALLRQLGLAVPDADFTRHLRSHLDELLRWVSQLHLSIDMRRPDHDDPRTHAAERLFSRLLPSAFFVGDGTLIAWIVVESQRMWAQHGPSAALAANLSCVGLVAAPTLGDYRTGYIVGRHLLAIAEARDYEPYTSVLRHRHALHSMPWIEPLENSIDQARRAQEGLLRDGDMQLASHTFYTVLPGQLECGPSLQTYQVQVESAMTLATRIGNQHAQQVTLAHQELAHRLRSASRTPEGGDGTSLAAETAASPNGAHTTADPFAVGMWHIGRSLSAAVFGDTDALIRHSELAIAYARFVPGYPVALARLLRALALATEIKQTSTNARSAMFGELDDYREWFAARAEDAPTNFLHLLRFIDAERAWSAGDLRAAAVAFDEALGEAADRERPWHSALIAERAAYLCLENGLKHAGRRLLTEARDRYEAWGADAKVHELDRTHPMLPSVRDARRHDNA